jgi:hypothetical protein
VLSIDRGRLSASWPAEGSAMLEQMSNIKLAAIVIALVLVACLMTWGVLTVSHSLQVAYITAQERGAVIPR